MAVMRYLLLAVTLACFFGKGLSATDQLFKVLPKTEKYTMAEVIKAIEELSSVVRSQASKIHHLEEQLEAAPGREVIQNNTIEERVTLLEIQMTVAQEDITELNQDVSGLDENIEFLFDEQVIQDERILTLEQDTDQAEDDIESLQVITLTLEFQVTVLENRTNSSEMRVETLEETAVNHETRITEAEGDIEALQGTSDDQETRLLTAEENIQTLQSTDLDHEARITSLEEHETIAFHAVLTSYDTIHDEATVMFNEIVLNEGNGYDSSTGIFTVPPGGDGTYYFSTYLLVDHGEYDAFDIQLNNEVICTAVGEHESSGAGDPPQATCSAVVNVVEGDEVKLVLRAFTDDTPLIESSTYYYSGFNGFRI